MKFKLEIDCDNAAFSSEPSHEIARILNGLVRKMGPRGIGSFDHVLADHNGNVVGRAWVES